MSVPPIIIIHPCDFYYKLVIIPYLSKSLDFGNVQKSEECTIAFAIVFGIIDIVSSTITLIKFKLAYFVRQIYMYVVKLLLKFIKYAELVLNRGKLVLLRHLNLINT